MSTTEPLVAEECTLEVGTVVSRQVETQLSSCSCKYNVLVKCDPTLGLSFTYDASSYGVEADTSQPTADGRKRIGFLRQNHYRVWKGNTPSGALALALVLG